jgi:Asp-tRNA(Asn)/Glu-tRNA(Gln) amidotransferase C subunit
MPADSNQTETQSILSSLSEILQSFKEYSNVDTTNLDTQINQLKTNVENADDANNELLLKQEDVKAIIDDEKTRIQSNIDSTENNLTTKKRLIEFNESNRLRTEQYNNILYVFVISLSIIVIIIVGGRQIEFLPDIIPQILVIIIGSISGIKIFQMYYNMNKRSHLDYNKLSLDKPVIDSPEQIIRSKEKAAKSGDLLGSISTNGCVGAECCDVGTTWNESSRKCTTIDNTTNEGFVTERFKYNHNIAPPNSPNEFNEYSKV